MVLLTIQADFLEDNLGSTNMKGFVMSLQKGGKLHHAILVEQVMFFDVLFSQTYLLPHHPPFNK